MQHIVSNIKINFFIILLFGVKLGNLIEETSPSLPTPLQELITPLYKAIL